jgi:long-chain fatty acid transport protein
MTSRKFILVAAAAAATLVAPKAMAAGFANTRIGGEQGTPVATNPTALYFNPAGMAFSEGTNLGLYIGVAVRDATWTRSRAPSDNPDPPGGQGANTGEAHLLNVLGGPTFGGTTKFGNLVLGAGFFAPFYGVQHWHSNGDFGGTQKYPLAYAGVQRFFSIDDDLEELYFSAGAAYRLGPVSIGATGNFISAFVQHTQAKTYSGNGLPDTAAEGRSVLDVSGFSGSFAAGAMVELLPKQLWIGASYQAQPGLGSQTLTGSLDNTDNHGVLKHYGNATFIESLPDVFRAGVRWTPKNSRFEIRVFGDLTRWSKLTTQCVGESGSPCGVNSDGTAANGAVTLQNNRLYLKDTRAARLGVSYWPSPHLEVFAGAGYETGATIDATMSPSLTDADNVQGSLGTRFRLATFLTLAVSYTHMQYFTRDNTGKSELAELNGMQVQPPTVQEDAGGVYTQWIGLLNVNLESQF